MNNQRIMGIWVLIVLCVGSALGQNPIIQTCYTADPAPFVYKDTVFLYTGHDEDKSTWFTMNDWKVFSSVDMVNWTSRGTPLSLKTFSWAKKNAWAGQCIERGGKFYWYVPVIEKSTGKTAIGVAVADHPTGPFKDALGKPLINPGDGYIDPTVFIDTDGQAYLYWGNPGLWYVKLNADMVSYKDSIHGVALTHAGFGIRTGDSNRATLYEEGPWFYKRGKLYYMLYAAGGIPEHIAYSTSDSPTGPWHYRDTIMTVQGGSFTNHCGVIDFKGKNYFFYHNGALPGGGGFTRSVCVEPFMYNPDGSFPRINMTPGIKEGVGTLNPFKRVEAETMALEKGVEIGEEKTGNVFVSDISNGDYIKVRNVDFRKGAKKFMGEFSAKGNSNYDLEIRLDSVGGRVIGKVAIGIPDKTGHWDTFAGNLRRVKGVHDLYLVFRNADKLDSMTLAFNWWKMSN
ncbi:glycoside hydrolase family 43 protein [Arachidicoccus ginsenosidivorans]